LALAVLTALGERDALQTMTDDEGLSLREASSGTRQPRDDFEVDAPVMSTKSESAAAA
jgi:hypothetical protein